MSQNTLTPPPTASASHSELAALIGRHCPTDGVFPTPVPGLLFFRMSAPNAPACSVVKSVFLIAAQGAKRVSLADETYDYDTGHYLITSVGLPLIGQVLDATPERPYLSLALDLDPLKISELMQKLPPPNLAAGSVRGLGVGALTPAIAGACATWPSRAARRTGSPAPFTGSMKTSSGPWPSRNWRPPSP